MEYLNKSKICREFLNQYSDKLIPELLPKLMKVAIYSLHKAFQKWNFSMAELDQFINYCCSKKNFEFECENNLPSPPCQEYLYPQVNRIQKLRMGFQPPEGFSNSEEDNGIIDCYGYGKYYPNDEVYINEKNNFYDENYYVPPNHSYRNIQLYHKRLKNPKFITQEKKIYPHWWWNQKDDIEQDDYDDDESSVLDHISRGDRIPKEIRDRLKKKAKRFPRNKSFSGIHPVRSRFYDEAKIFPNIGAVPYHRPKEGLSPSVEDYSRYPYDMKSTDGFGRTKPNLTGAIDTDGRSNNPNDNSGYISDKPLYSTSTYFRPQTLGPRPGTDEQSPDGFHRTRNPRLTGPRGPNENPLFTDQRGPNETRGSPGPRNPNDYPGSTGPKDPKDYPGTTGTRDPNDYPGSTDPRDPRNYPGYTGLTRPNEYPGSTGLRGPNEYPGSTGLRGPNDTVSDGISPLGGKQLSPTQIFKLNRSLAGRPMSLDGTLYGTSALKSKILSKRKIGESSAFTYDKKFNVIGAKIKKQGQIKKGLKYSLCGNQLKEDERGIIRRKKKQNIN